MGRGGLIQVGDRPEDLEATKVVKRGEHAAKRLEPLFETVQ
jgi:hypothetical protein